MKPHPVLMPYVSNYTLTFPTKQVISEAYAIIPHGCATLVFGIKDQKIDGRLFGPATKAVTVGDQAGDFDQIFIIEFQPAGLYTFLGFNQQELADQIVPFELVWPQLNQTILNLLEMAEDIQLLFETIDRLLVQAILKEHPPELKISSEEIIQQAGNLSLQSLSDKVFYSERHLTRLYNEYVGMSTKQFTRLVRVNKAIRLLHEPKLTIREVYETIGYYDSSHFTRDFKQIAGTTPQVYRNKMSDFYSEIAKF